MPIVSVCLIANSHNNYDFLALQDWTGVELIVGCKTQDENRIKHLVFSNSTFENIKIVYYHSNLIENDILEICDSEYTIWLHSDESWNSDFLTQLKDFIYSNKNSDDILYITGFVKKGKQIFRATNIYPFIQKTFSLSKIFVYPYYFIPSVKFLWKTDLVKEYGLSFDNSLQDHLLKEVCFNVDYLTTLFEINGYNEHKYKTETLSFYHIFNKQINLSFLSHYREKIVDKRSIFMKNSWSKLFWQYLFSEKYKKFILLKQEILKTS